MASNKVQVVVNETPVIVNETDAPVVSVEIANTGPQGPAGPSQVVAYHYVQNSTSDVWVINHNLGFYPNVTVQNSAGETCEGEIVYTTTNSLTITFSSAFSGEAYLS